MTPPHAPHPGNPDEPRRERPGEDYLWDRSGTPDPVVARLETLLAPLAHDADASRLPIPERRLAPFTAPRRLYALAAVFLLGFAGLWYGVNHAADRRPGWQVEQVLGSPRAAGASISSGSTLRVGDWLETDAASRARVSVADIGTLDIAEGTRLRILGTAHGRHEVDLAHGRIEAIITAPPSIFFVHTPAALATDMGCRYELDVPRDGPGLLTVTLGWVLLERPASATPDPGAAWAARVPRGVSCTIDPVAGPGTPFRLGSAVEPLIAELDARAWEDLTSMELADLLDTAGRADAVTLWHVLLRVPEAQRAAVVERLRVIITLPASLDMKGLVELREADLECLWGEVMWSS